MNATTNETRSNEMVNAIEKARKVEKFSSTGRGTCILAKFGTETSMVYTDGDRSYAIQASSLWGEYEVTEYDEDGRYAQTHVLDDFAAGLYQEHMGAAGFVFVDSVTA